MCKNFIKKLDNISASVNASTIFDDDSVNFAIVTRPSKDASGTYTVKVNFLDYFNNNTLNTLTLTMTASPPATLPTYSPDVMFLFCTLKFIIFFINLCFNLVFINEYKHNRC
jgi:hypothetical protein